MPIIGIDLGTSNSAAAVLRGGRPVIIPSSEGVTLGGKAFPSYVAIAPDGQIIVGEPARRQQAINPEGTVSGFKRLMGQRDKLRLGGKPFAPEELSAVLLQKIKRDAEAFLGKPVGKAVVEGPAAKVDDRDAQLLTEAVKTVG
jgi:molecular chaperone DnaK